MTDIILVAVIGAMVVAAVRYIIRARRSGAKCIGCPSGGCCSHGQGEMNSCACGGGGQEHGCRCHGEER